MKDGVYLGEDVDQAHAQGLIDQLNAIHYPKPQTNPIKIKGSVAKFFNKVNLV
ncbi:TPA: alpha/beta hydrolase [Enterococcus faecalis]|mgnify:CR=1 FL=1|uniref:Uncharacterized protein n=3 Tax=Enterococcus faecalis TaxID=1351 RepID=A0AAV3GPK7_ENTFL|nr:MULTISPECIES: hypothetical protein [Bacilli]EFE18766.1 hypothetical protein HMPREF9376_02237 [Enterococcus faecalis S613]EFQ09073.1 hypothetical protein HMPREF9492_02553 [Enterococcus faecalis DAPTO 512]EJU89690.1 hypothetical protein HMPREF1329_00900 [Enterococcus faecalis ERV116]EJU89776.1 hypothetical protein HMPREF1328_01291 [Enterococcus faecalis ERV103]EJU98041.1 hypothetical protein HMPREF1330_01543 [Enterococcus faecalis ERV129]EJU98393.1 hypothetical protein HMPREF1332_01525 [Ente